MTDNAIERHRPQPSKGWEPFARRLTVSNVYLDDEHRHSDEDLLMLRLFGWIDPTTGPGTTPLQDPDGSPKHYREWGAPVNFPDVAITAVRTFIEVLEITSPGWLEYRALDGESREMLLPTLGLKRTVG